MKIPLSSRLLACCDLVRPGDRVADIGCDHGYLGIYLLQKGIAATVIASDINEGPLQSAVVNSEKYGVRDRMTFYLSDGVQNLPREFDALVCAGMGGDTMVSILSAAPWLKHAQYRLILQCQSRTPVLRRYLHENGWEIAHETILRDGRFLYTVMEALWKGGIPTAADWTYYYPPTLLFSPTKESIEYYHRVVNKLRLSVEGHGEQADPTEKSVLRLLEALKDKYPFLKEDSL